MVKVGIHKLIEKWTRILTALLEWEPICLKSYMKYCWFNVILNHYAVSVTIALRIWLKYLTDSLKVMTLR